MIGRRSTGDGIDRRMAMFGAAGAGLALTGATAHTAVRGSRSSALVGTCTTPRSAVARTRYGPVRGYLDNGAFTFKGIPYGDTTAAENRWLPAKPPKPWTDEYHAMAYGANCPQTLHSFRAVEHTFLQQWTDGFMGEDMLKVNIWTPALSGSRPVMVYFHGGGFSFGSSYELLSHDGANMARNHDVVQVSVNHRLNVLGFLDLAEMGGAAYEDSVNCSMTDAVAALQWVHENIAAFGGDPDRVMIYGQSGGGSKVTTLLGMSLAKGLIHRASIQSGGGGNIPALEQSREFSRRLMRELGIAKGDMASLQKAEWNTLFTAGNNVAAEINGPTRGNPLVMGPGAFATPRVGWAPTLDGKNIDVRAYQDVAPDISRDVPVMIGNVSEEGTGYGRNPSEAEWRAQLAETLGAEKADRLIMTMKAAHPEKSVRTLSYGVQGLSARNNVQRMVKLKHAQQAAPAYQYLFQWQSPQLDGVAGAWHTAELAFCFDNTDLCAQATCGGEVPRTIGHTMSTAWATFARTGNPSQPGLTWTPSDPDRCQTMVFDTKTRMVDDPESAARHILLT